jgi:dynein heavy chain, axonemal
LYFILNDMHKVNPIYQFSLKAFTAVFKDAIARAPQDEDENQRVRSLVDAITFDVFMYTSRGLFERDKLIFMSQMVIQIMMQAKKIVPHELDFLLRFPYTPNMQSPFEFLSNISWGGLTALSNMDEFMGLDKDIEASPNRWKKFIDADAPEKEKIPGEWKHKTPLETGW